MAISRTQAVSANANTVAITSTANNDLILVFAYFKGTATVPSLAAGFTNITSSAGTGQACRMGYKTSAGGDTSSGVWTNATQVVCHVYRGTLAGAGGIGSFSIGAGNSVSPAYPARSLTVTDGTSWVVGFGGHSGATAGMNGTPTGTAPNLGNRTNQVACNGLDTGAGVTGFTVQTLTVTTTGRWQAPTVEIKAAPPVIMDGLTGSFAETGGNAALVENKTEDGLSGSYGVTGGDAVMVESKRIAASTGAVSLTGGDAIMTVIPVAGGGLADGDPVATWPDSSGNGNDATNAVVINQPIFKTNIINGLPVVRFDGVNDSFLHSVNLSESTVFVVGAIGVAASTLPSYALMVAMSSASRIVARLSGTHWGSWQFTGGEVDSGEDLVTGAANILVARSSTISNTGSVYRNGTLKATGTALHGGSNEIGAEGGARYFNGDIAEIIIYNTGLSSTDRANVEAYLGAKYGITVLSGGTAADPTSISGLQLFLKADSLLAGAATVYNMAGDTGSFASTGGTAGMVARRQVVASTGSYAETGGAAIFLHPRLAAGATGVFALAGNAAKTLWSHKTIGLTGAYVETGGPALMSRAKNMVSSTGAFVLAGNAAKTLWAHRAVGVTGVYTETGGPAFMSRAKCMVSSTGAFALAGNAARLIKAFKVAGTTGTYTAAGIASLLAKHLLAGANGAYIETGGPAFFKILTIGNIFVGGETGFYLASGRDAYMTIGLPPPPYNPPVNTGISVVPQYPHGHEITPTAPEQGGKPRRWQDKEMFKLG